MQKTQKTDIAGGRPPVRFEREGVSGSAFANAESGFLLENSQDTKQVRRGVSNKRSTMMTTSNKNNNNASLKPIPTQSPFKSTNVKAIYAGPGSSGLSVKKVLNHHQGRQSTQTRSPAGRKSSTLIGESARRNSS